MMEAAGLAQKTRGRKSITALQYKARQQEILRAANRLFAQKGYQGVSMRRLADEANMSPMSLYRYFANKRAILIHIWADVFQKVFAKCRQCIRPDMDPAAQLEAYGICFVMYWIDNPEHYLMIYGEIDTPGKAEGFFAQSELVRDELSFVQTLLERAGVSAQGVSTVCQQWLCVLHGVSHSLVTIPEMNWASPNVLVSGVIKGLIAQAKK